MDRSRSSLEVERLPVSFALCLLFCFALLMVAPISHAKQKSEVKLPQLLHEARLAVEAEEYDAALDLYRHAQHLLHREYGVLSPRQNELLEQMAKIYLAQGSFSDANNMMELRHRSIAAASNESAEAMLPAWQALGNWYQKTLQPKKSQRAFHAALEIIEAHGMPEAELATIHLAMLKNEYLLVQCCDLDAAKDVVHDLSLTTEQWLELGDLALLAGQHKEAELFYFKSGATLAATPIGTRRIDHLARTYVQATLDRRSRMSILTSAEMTPTQLVGAPLPMCESRVADISGKQGYENFTMDISFKVNRRGMVRGVKVAQSSAPGSIDGLLRKQMASLIYRPELQEGQVRSSKVTFNQRFDRLANPGPAEQRAATMLGCVAAARALESDIFVVGVN